MMQRELAGLDRKEMDVLDVVMAQIWGFRDGHG